jgi:phenylacetic acid degradation operon negative regulatory protein
MDPLASLVTRTLVARFRRQRPLRSGSLLITIFGDAIAPRGGAVSLGSLIALAAPFGVSERLVRTSVGRLAQDRWLAGRRDRRLSEYRLTAAGRARFADATRRIYGGGDRKWARKWTLTLLPPASAPQREALRKPLAWLGFGELAPGVLAHPTCEVEAVRISLRDVPLGNRVVIMRASTGDPSTDGILAAAGWNLAQLAGRYRRFVRQFEPIRLAPPADPPSAFVARTLLIHEYRKILLRDPLLPAELLPPDWAGSAAYGVCHDLYARLFLLSEAHLDTVAGRLDGTLPPLEESALLRFGGLGATPVARGVRSSRR